MLDLEKDRRECPRISWTRPCKAFEPRSRKYIAGTTCNVSPGGMLLRLQRPVPLEIDDVIYIAVAAKRRQGLLASGDMVEARVVRSLPMSSGETAVAVRFRDGESRRLPLAMAA